MFMRKKNSGRRKRFDEKKFEPSTQKSNYDKTYDIEAMKIVAKLIFNGMYSFCFMESFFIDKVYS